MDKVFVVVLVCCYCDIYNNRKPTRADKVYLAHLLQPFVKARQRELKAGTWRQELKQKP